MRSRAHTAPRDNLTAGEFPQEYFKNVAYFQLPKSTVNQPPFTTQFTTTSPQKHHAKTPVFRKPPQKNAPKTPKNTLSRPPQFFLK
jgi:hypothetical protein